MKNILLIVIGAIITCILVCIVSYNVSLSSVSNKSQEVEFSVYNGDTLNAVIKNLVSEGIIKSELAAKIYVKLNNDLILQAGDYVLNKNMSTQEILKSFEDGVLMGDYISITFTEGKRLIDYVELASSKLGFDYDDAIALVNSVDYIKGLIESEKYWFLTNEILNENIYYALEGYLFPDTYNFYLNATIEDVFTTMLDTMLLKLEPLKSDVANSTMTIHQMLTLASIVENEARVDDDRAMVSGVFINRINDGWSLGSDVTTYYGVQKVFGDWLTYDEYRDCSNQYNTRCTSYIGLSVGPINSPSISAITAAINPSSHNYYYFVADCSGKSYFNYNETGHQNTITELKNNNNWCDV